MGGSVSDGPTSAGAQPSLSVYDPPLREQLAWMIANQAAKMGAGRYLQQDIAHKVGGLLDFIPGVGEALGADDVATSLGQGDYKGAALNGIALGMGAVPVAGDLAGKVVKNSGIRLNDLMQTLSERGPLFVRWSRGPEFDMQPGAVSRDYVTGQPHSGLSAIQISADTSPSQLLRELRDYSFLRLKDDKIRPHVYAAKQVGRDSDNAPSIRPTEHVGFLSDDLVRFMDNDANIERLALMESIDQNRRALEYYKQNPPTGYKPIWTEDSLRRLEKTLADRGGPLTSLP